jgi:predicted branched-subunit amino acid permease
MAVPEAAERASASLRFDSLDLRALWRHPGRVQGMKDMTRVMPGLMAWAVITGVVMAKSGLPTWVAASMALCVFAASAQLSAVPLLMAGAPLWVIWLTAACVNLRFVIFSAQMRRHMMCLPWHWRLLAGYLSADVVYVMAVNRHGDSPGAGPAHTEPLAYFLGLAAVNWTGWSMAALGGVLCAAWIPTQWGLGFAGALALLALLVNLSRDRRTFVSALAAGATAAALYDLPFKLYIVVAVVTGVGLGLGWDAWRPVPEAAPGSEA